MDKIEAIVWVTPIIAARRCVSATGLGRPLEFLASAEGDLFFWPYLELLAGPPDCAGAGMSFSQMARWDCEEKGGPDWGS